MLELMVFTPLHGQSMGLETMSYKPDRSGLQADRFFGLTCS